MDTLVVIFVSNLKTMIIYFYALYCQDCLEDSSYQFRINGQGLLIMINFGHGSPLREKAKAETPVVKKADTPAARLQRHRLQCLTLHPNLRCTL
jgi:hypothetical protein